MSETLTLQLPPVAPPESNLIPGMAAPAPRFEPEVAAALAVPGIGGLTFNLADTSISGPVQLQAPAGWSYDFDPVSGNTRAQYPGAIVGPTLAPGANNQQMATTAFVTAAVVAATTGVSSFNTRTGAVVLTTADVTGAGGAPAASPTLTGTTTAAALTVTGAASTGALTATTLTTTSRPTSIVGVADGSAAATGIIGEWITGTGGPASMPNGGWLNTLTFSLPAGDWDVSGYAVFTPSTANLQGCGWLVSTSPTAPAGNMASAASLLGWSAASPAGGQNGGPTVPVRMSVASATSIYLLATASFPSGGTVSANTAIFARRIR